MLMLTKEMYCVKASIVLMGDFVKEVENVKSEEEWEALMNKHIAMMKMFVDMFKNSA
jgi:hypothetical protein